MSISDSDSPLSPGSRDSTPPRPPPLRAVPHIGAPARSIPAWQRNAVKRRHGIGSSETGSDAPPSEPGPESESESEPETEGRGADMRTPRASKSASTSTSASTSRRTRTRTRNAKPEPEAEQDSDDDPPRPVPVKAVPKRPRKATTDDGGPETVAAPRAKRGAARPAPAPKAKRARKKPASDSEEDVPRPPPVRAAPRASAVRARAAVRQVESSGSGSESESSGLASSEGFVDDEEEESEGFVDEEESDASVASEDIDTAPQRAKGSLPDGKPRKKGRPPPKTKLPEESDSEIELEEGQTIIARIRPAPKKGWVPPGQISRNTLAFLEALMYPAQNDREWFRAHEPWFRKSEQEWRDFAQHLQTLMAQQDTQLPIVPARDLCHRIYRDVRFSQDKSPYKTNYGMTTSRSGRKGPWAGYHLYLCPGDTFIACGLWQPDKNVLGRMRERFMNGGGGPLKHAISRPQFVELFGPPSPSPNGSRRNIFGHGDELKVAPKGIDKTHPEIALLKLRSFVVIKPFSEAEVLDAGFAQRVADVVGVMAPFVHTLNDYVAGAPQNDGSDVELVG